MTTTNSLLVASGLAGNADLFGTSYGSVADALFSNSTEALAQHKAVTAFTLLNFGVRVTVNTLGSPTAYVSRIGGANGNLSVTPTGNTTGWYADTTHSDSIAATNLYNFRRSNFNITLSLATFTAQKTSPIMEWIGNVNGNISFSATTQYGFPYGILHAALTESYLQTMVRAAGTWQSLSIQINTGSSGTVTVKSRKGGADGSQALSIASGTGWTQDTTHTDSIASGDSINHSVVSTNASGNYNRVASEFLGTISAHETGSCSANGTAGVSLTASTTYFPAAYGSLTTNTTETNAKLHLPYALTLSKLRSKVITNSAATPSIKSRKNGADGNNVISVSSGTTGDMEDTTHSDSYAANDDLNTTMVVGSITTLNIRDVRMLLDDGSVVAFSTETGTATLAFSGVSYVGAGNRKETGSGTLAFSGISFVASGSHIETGTGRLSFSGISFVASGSHTETGTGRLSFSGISFVASGSRIHVKGTALLTFGGIAIHGTGYNLRTPGTGVRQGWTH